MSFVRGLAPAPEDQRAICSPLLRFDRHRISCPGRYEHFGLAYIGLSPSEVLPYQSFLRDMWRLLAATCAECRSMRGYPQDQTTPSLDVCEATKRGVGFCL